MKNFKIWHCVLILLFVSLVACGNPQEAARFQLAEMKVEFSPDNFVKCARAGNLEKVRLFLQAGMDPNVTNKQGETALLNAARYGRLEVVELLLAQGADVKVRDSKFRITALMWAATIGHTPIVKLLLDHGADLEARDNRQGVNALMAGSTNGQTDTVIFLLDRGTKINARDNFNRTALIWASHYGRTR